MNKGIFAALEELDEGSAIYGDTPYGEGIDGAEENSREENLRREVSDEINLSADHLGSLNEVVNQSQGAVDDLTAIGDSLSTESEVFNIDEVSIKPTIIAVEALYRKLGVNEVTLPSLESFSNSKFNKLAVEQFKVSIEEKTEEAKSGIKKMMEKIWNFIKDLFEKIISAFKRLFTPSIKGLIKKLEALKTTEPKEKEINDERLVKAFGKPGSNVSKSEVKTVIGTCDKIVNIGESLTEASDSGKNSFKIDDLIYDSLWDLHADEEGKAIFEFKSGWDGKEADGKTIELSNKSECIELLNELDKVPKQLLGLYAKFKMWAVTKSQVKKMENEHAPETSKTVAKSLPKLIGLLNKTVNAGIDYCNKSYKQIKANEDK